MLECYGPLAKEGGKEGSHMSQVCSFSNLGMIHVSWWLLLLKQCPRGGGGNGYVKKNNQHGLVRFMNLDSVARNSWNN